MRTAVLCIFFFVAAWALPKGQEDVLMKRMYAHPLIKAPPKDINGRITNGREVVPHSIPYQAYLVVTSFVGQRWMCGGSLISAKYVLTAAHCLVDGASAIITLGIHNVQRPESSQVTVESINLMPHPDYNPELISDDIGLILLHEPVALNEYVNVATLPRRQSNNNYEGANARVSGWGRVSGEGSTSSVLLEVNSTVMSNAECRRYYSIVIDSQVCIAGTGGVGSCNGDSGGPLVVDAVQIGIVSYGATKCPPGYPSAFTRISSYFDWLEDNTGIKF